MTRTILAVALAALGARGEDFAPDPRRVWSTPPYPSGGDGYRRGGAFSDAAGATKFVVNVGRDVEVYSGAADAANLTLEANATLDFACSRMAPWELELSSTERKMLLGFATAEPACDCAWSENNTCPQDARTSGGLVLDYAMTTALFASAMADVEAPVGFGLSDAPGGLNEKAAEGCSEFSAASKADVKDKYCLVHRGTCNFRVKLGNCVAAGAVGAVVVGEGSLSAMSGVAADDFPSANFPFIYLELAEGTALITEVTLNNSTTLKVGKTTGPSAPGAASFGDPLAVFDPLSGARLTPVLDHAALGFRNAQGASQPGPDLAYFHAVDSGDAGKGSDWATLVNFSDPAAPTAVCSPATFSLSKSNGIGAFPDGMSAGHFDTFRQTVFGKENHYAIYAFTATLAPDTATMDATGTFGTKGYKQGVVMIMQLDENGCPLAGPSYPLVLPTATLDDGNFDQDGKALVAFTDLVPLLLGGADLPLVGPGLGIGAGLWKKLAACGDPSMYADGSLNAKFLFDVQASVAVHPSGDYVYSAPGTRTGACPYVVHAYDVSGLKATTFETFHLALSRELVHYAGSFEIPAEILELGGTTQNGEPMHAWTWEGAVAQLNGGAAGAVFLDFTDDPVAPAFDVYDPYVGAPQLGRGVEFASLGDDGFRYVRVAGADGVRFDAVAGTPLAPPGGSRAPTFAPTAAGERVTFLKEHLVGVSWFPSAVILAWQTPPTAHPATDFFLELRDMTRGGGWVSHPITTKKPNAEGWYVWTARGHSAPGNVTADFPFDCSSSYLARVKAATGAKSGKISIVTPYCPGDCVDSTSWYFNAEDKDCAWIGDRIANNAKVDRLCSKTSKAAVDGYTACPNACGKCGDTYPYTPAPTTTSTTSTTSTPV